MSTKQYIAYVKKLSSELADALNKLGLTELSKQLHDFTRALDMATRAIRVMNLALAGNPVGAAIAAAMLIGSTIIETMPTAGTAGTATTTYYETYETASQPNTRESTP